MVKRDGRLIETTPKNMLDTDILMTLVLESK
jgi:hypothetical protein